MNTLSSATKLELCQMTVACGYLPDGTQHSQPHSVHALGVCKFNVIEVTSIEVQSLDF